jgi:hypothetical protein
MQNHWKYAAAALTLAGAIGCGSSTPTNTPTDAAPDADDATALPDASGDAGADAPGDRADAPRADAPRTDAGSCPVAPTPMGTSRAGAMCTDNAACGAGLECDTDFLNGYCSTECTNNASQACEAAQCGGNGATCLSLGDGADALMFCAPTCNPSARAGMPGTCRAGTVCTGWWYTHGDGAPDRPGCEYFCSSNAHCPAGMPCNLRTGECGMAASTTLRADGEPCNPQMDPDTGPSVQCRGYCFVETDNDREGLCGSLLDIGATPNCHDNPTLVHPIAPSDDNGRTDNLGLCIYRECTTDADCTLPLHCVAGTDGDPNVCTYGDGIPAPDGGVRDGGSDAAPADASADAPGG